jgi:hypothetical protein
VEGDDLFCFLVASSSVHTAYKIGASETQPSLVRCGSSYCKIQTRIKRKNKYEQKDLHDTTNKCSRTSTTRMVESCSLCLSPFDSSLTQPASSLAPPYKVRGTCEVANPRFSTLSKVALIIASSQFTCKVSISPPSSNDT